MKIAHCFFPLEKVGGIKTWADYFDLGLVRLGLDVKVDRVFISTNTTRLPNFDVVNKAGFGNFDKIFGFEKTEWLGEFRNYLMTVDYIIMGVPCPHLLKNYKSENWKAVYQMFDQMGILDKIVVALHDPYLGKYYPWLQSILEKYNMKVLCPQKKMQDSVKYINVTKRFFHNPYESSVSMEDFEKVIEGKIADIAIDLNNFKGCKHKQDIFKYDEFNKLRILEFGDDSSMDYNLFMKELEEKKWEGVKVVGWVGHDEIGKYLKKASFGIDLSRFGHVNCNIDYTIIEYIDYGLMPVVQFPIDPYYGFGSMNINQVLIYDKVIVMNNKLILNEKMDLKKTVSDILEYLQEKRTMPTKKSYW